MLKQIYGFAILHGEKVAKAEMLIDENTSPATAQRLEPFAAMHSRHAAAAHRNGGDIRD